MQLFLICVALGAVVGFLAGLLGIGGGLIIVPALLYILPSVGFPSNVIPHAAIATSLAAIILTSLSSVYAHNKRGNISWPLAPKIFPGIIVGGLAAGFIADKISGASLTFFFAVFVLVMSVQMLYPVKPNRGETLPNSVGLFIIAIFIALIAGLMGIGGGALLVPFLSWCGLEMRKAVGLSSATGLLIAISGTFAYIISGWDQVGLPEFTLGYIYLPALLGIVITSIFIAPLGVKAASVWPTSVLKKIFALLLAVIGLKMLLS